MPMERSGNDVSFMLSREVFTMFGMLQGAGAAAPTIPTTVSSGTSSKGFMTAINNCMSGVAGDIVRNSAGNYTVKVKSGLQLPVMFDVSANVWGPSGIWSSVSDYNPTTRALTFLTFAAGGAAADITTAEFVHFTFTGQLNPE